MQGLGAATQVSRVEKQRACLETKTVVNEMVRVRVRVRVSRIEMLNRESDHDDAERHH